MMLNYWQWKIFLFGCCAGEICVTGTKEHTNVIGANPKLTCAPRGNLCSFQLRLQELQDMITVLSLELYVWQRKLFIHRTVMKSFWHWLLDEMKYCVNKSNWWKLFPFRTQWSVVPDVFQMVLSRPTPWCNLYNWYHV